MIALTAGESKNPKKDLPAAIKQTFWRILIIFLGLIFFASIIVPSNDDQLLHGTGNSGKSPWTIALVRAGWPGAGSLLNVVMITAQFSSINSAIYVAARSLLNLSQQGRAPKFFAKTSVNGVPVRSTIFCNFLGLIALMNIATGPGAVFTYLLDISGEATYITWLVIGITHIRMRKGWVAQGHSIDELPFKALWYPYGAYFVIGINSFLIIICGYTAFIGHFQPLNFTFTYVTPVIFIILFIFWKVYKKTKWVAFQDMDLVTGRKIEQEIRDTEDEDEKKSKGKFGWAVKAKRFVFS
jgi:yeast amino acid transporter